MMDDNNEYRLEKQPQSPQNPEDHHHHGRVHPAKKTQVRRSSPVPSILSSSASITSISYRPFQSQQQQQQQGDEAIVQQSPSPSSSFSTRLLKLRSSRTEPFKRRLPKFDLLSFNDLSLRRRRPSEPTLSNTLPPPPLPQVPSSQSLLTKALPSLPLQPWSTTASALTATLAIENDEGERWQTVQQVCTCVRSLCASEDTMSWYQLSMLLKALEDVGAKAGAKPGGVLSANKDTLDKLRAHCEHEEQMTQVILGIDALAESWLIEYGLTQHPLLLKAGLSESDFCTELPQFIIQQLKKKKGSKQQPPVRTLPDYISMWPDHLNTNTLWFRNYFIGKPYVTFVRLGKPTTVISVVHHNDETVYRVIIRMHGMDTQHHCIREDQMMNGVDGHRHAVAIACSSRINLREVKDFSAEATILSGTEKELLRFDEMAAPKQYKFGVIHVKSGQDAEELWLANSELTTGLERLLDLVGERIELKGYTGYAGGLDTRAGESGEVSYVSKWRNHEIMFHVGPLMPQRENDQQQVHRKRYIGNDIVCLVFVDKYGKFDPSKIRSRFLHVFVVVQQLDDRDYWRVEVIRSTNVRVFGPIVPSPAQLSSEALRDFLLLKMVSAENAALKSDEFAIPTEKARDHLLTNIASGLVNHGRISSPATSPSKSERPRSSGGGVSSSLWRPAMEHIPIPPIPDSSRSTMLRDIKDGFVRRRRRSEGVKSSTSTNEPQQQQQKLSASSEASLPASKRSNSFSSRLGRRAGVKRTDITL